MAREGKVYGLDVIGAPTPEEEELQSLKENRTFTEMERKEATEKQMGLEGKKEFEWDSAL